MQHIHDSNTSEINKRQHGMVLNRKVSQVILITRVHHPHQEQLQPSEHEQLCLIVMLQ
jgi:hypothetical protein